MVYFEFRPSGPIFAYMSEGAFRSVVVGKRLWFSDLSAANDPRELHLGRDLFFDAVKALGDEGKLTREDARRLSRFAVRLAEYQRNSITYTCCFTQESDALPLWNAYGGGYTGLAIGFRPAALTGIPARLQRVSYQGDNTPAAFRELALGSASQLGTGLIGEITAISEVTAAITALKHPTWAYEREVRMVFNQVIERPDSLSILQGMVSGHPDGVMVPWREPLKRMVGSREVGYLDFPFGKYLRDGEVDPARAIQRVVIGPNCALTERETGAILTSEGFEEFEVVKSACEIRL